MADSNRPGGNSQDYINSDSNGPGASANMFDNMESLATAAHAQAQQQPAPASYSLQQPTQHVPTSASQNIVDPMYYLNDPASQQQAHQAQQFYTQQTSYASSTESGYPSSDQLRHSLQQQLGNGSMEFQHLLGQIQYPNASGNSELLAMQQRAQMMAQHHMRQEQQQQQQLQQFQHQQQQSLLHQQHTQSPTSQMQAQTRNYTLPAPPPPIAPPSTIPTESSEVSTPQTERGESAKPSVSAVRTVPDRTLTKNRADFRPKTAIPQDLTAEEYAGQCIQAAIASRLPPYYLHRLEYEMLREHINHVQVTTYLHIRNGIVRLWQRNPLVSVTREEAAGCAKDYRFFDVAEVAYDWLVRNGYINFGCIEVPSTVFTPINPTKRRKTVVVIGAGMSGLGCARQLEGIFSQFGDKMADDELPPQVIVLEARGRIGGRVYSHPLKTQSGADLPAGKRSTADLGAQVITGFENGNPLGVLVRGQLALEYHTLRDNSVLYDSDGTPVDKERDVLVERLFNDILDRVSIYKQKPELPKTTEGDRELIDSGKDPTGEGGRVISAVEDGEVTVPPLEIPAGASISGNGPFSAHVDKITGKPTISTGSSASILASAQASALGWELKPDLTGHETIKIDPQGSDPKFPTLGKTMDSVLRQYQELLDITDCDLRIMNWHYANLEYANASNVDALSLGHWDQDDGQEPAGPHTTLLGGYMQVPRGLMLAPKRLDVKTRHVVKKITYVDSSDNENEEKLSRVECDNGVVIDADRIVVTLPLGVLKAGSVEFDPPLPGWKASSIEKLGYGLLNKVVLVFDEPFWDVDNDMVGLLRDPMGDPRVQESYEANRGKFYMFWNCIKISGKPVLVSLIVGDAATQIERETDEAIVTEAISVLRKMYPTKVVSTPVEAIITRWRKDPYSRGSYSYVGPEATAEDYDHMAKPVGKCLFFAGEASCKAYPATVHGAYISGLRAAAEVADSLLGPIYVPSPLIPPKPKLEGSYSGMISSRKRKAEESAIEKARELRASRLEEHERAMNDALLKALGERPAKPGRSGANPFLLYQKDHWFICKDKCDEARRKATNNPEAKATRNEVRAALGQMWRDAPEEQKRPYLSETERNKELNAAGINDFKKRLKEWDAAATKFKKEWKEKNPTEPTEEENQAVRAAELEKQEIKRSRKLNGYLEDSEDEEEY